MKSLSLLVVALAFALPVHGQAYRCTSPDGKITYQQTPCPKASEEKQVDTTPASSADPHEAAAAREKLLREGAEASKRLEARAAADEADRQRRAEQRARDEAREREAQAQEAARDNPGNIYAWPGYTPPNYPRPPFPPQPRPIPPRPGSPQPTPQTR